MSVIVGLTSDSSALSQQNTDTVEFRDRAQRLADDFAIPSADIDNLAVTKFNSIIQTQNYIITAGGNTGLASACYSADTNLFTTNYGDLVTGVAVTLGANTGIVGIGSSTPVAIATLKLDVLEAYRYPKIESGTLDTSTDNPFVGEGYVTLTSGNAGIGNSTRYTRGAGAGSTVFALIGGCNTTAGINTLRTLYNSQISGMSSFVSAATVVKGEKTEYQFHVWSYGRKIATNNVGISSITSTIDILENPGLGGPY